MFLCVQTLQYNLGVSSKETGVKARPLAWVAAGGDLKGLALAACPVANHSLFSGTLSLSVAASAVPLGSPTPLPLSPHLASEFETV